MPEIDMNAISDDVKVPTGNDDIENLLKGYTENMSVENDEIVEKPSKKKKVKFERKVEADDEPVTVGGELLTGAMLLTLIDTIIPLAITFINDRVTKKPMTKAHMQKLKLTKPQLKELEPLCDQVAAQYTVTANPTVLLMVSLLGIYGVNYMSIKSTLE